MKKFLFILLLLLGGTMFAQNKGNNVVTTYVTSQTMHWSDSDERWIFVPSVDRHRANCVWNFVINEDLTGMVTMKDLSDGEQFRFQIYEWFISQTQDGNDMLTLKTVDVGNGKSVDILVQSNVYNINEKMIACMMPESNLALFFDNFVE